MVQTTSTLDIADNSGAKKVMCIRVLGGTRRKYASLGDVIVVSIKEAIPNAKVKKGEIAKAVIVRTKEGSVEASNVALWCGKCVAPRRARHEGEGTAKKRVCVKCGNAFETA